MISKKLTIFKSRINKESIQGPAGVQSVEQFWVMLERERARVDRNSHYFSVVSFEMHESSDDLIKTSRLLHVLSRRIRQSDCVGWLNHRQVGVFLPDTLSGGACKFADDIFQSDRANDLPIKYTVFTYPAGKFTAIEKEINSHKEHDMIPSQDEQNYWGVHQDIVYESVNPSGSEIKKGINLADNSSTEKLLEKHFATELPPWKRLMDILGSLLGIFFLSPLFLIIASYIKVVSPGPIFFKQERIGFKGERFKFWKFRTMHVDADTQIHEQHLKTLINNDIPMEKLETEKDPRIIPFGKFLRQSCLDELPQLINVLRGDMSLIGPRPCLPYEAQEYNLWHTKRFDIKPGMTGNWQVNGKNRTTFNRMIRLDLNYIKHLSLGLDIKILLRTVPAIIHQIVNSKRKGQR